MGSIAKIPNIAALILVQLYRALVSPFLGTCCRFHPSCSHYAKQVLQQYSFPKACWLIVTRLSRCHPWHPGGLDEVPKPRLTQSVEDQFK